MQNRYRYLLIMAVLTGHCLVSSHYFLLWNYHTIMNSGSRAIVILKFLLLLSTTYYVKYNSHRHKHTHSHTPFQLALISATISLKLELRDPNQLQCKTLAGRQSQHYSFKYKIIDAIIFSVSVTMTTVVVL